MTYFILLLFKLFCEFLFNITFIVGMNNLESFVLLKFLLKYSTLTIILILFLVMNLKFFMTKSGYVKFLILSYLAILSHDYYFSIDEILVSFVNTSAYPPFHTTRHLLPITYKMF
jgi:hypothetical protein